MRIDLKKMAITSVAGAVLGIAGAAQANNSLLFPFVTSANGTYTFVTVYENPFPAGGLSDTPTGGNVGFRVSYGFKDADSSPTAACSYSNFDIAMKQGGLLQWDAAGRLDLPSDFGDDYRGELMGLPGNTEGFMIVEYNDPASAAGTLHGDAIVINTATGMILSYAATNSTGNDFSTDGSSEFTSSWLPRSVAGTTWYALPLGTRDAMVRSNSQGISGKIVARTNVQKMGAYERNGAYYTGVKEQPFTCFGVFGIDDLLQRGYDMGGWASFKTLKRTAANTSNAAADAQPAQIWKLVQSGEIGIPTAAMNPIEALR